MHDFSEYNVRRKSGDLQLILVERLPGNSRASLPHENSLFFVVKKFVKSVFRSVKPLIDILLSPFTLIGAVYFLFLKRIGLRQLRVSRMIFNVVGMFPIIDHYYEPLFNPRHLSHPLDKDRPLPGINFNENGQLALLSRFHFNEELENIPLEPTGNLSYHFHNRVRRHSVH